MEKEMHEYHEYIASSERAYRRSDERSNHFWLEKILCVGERFEMEGIFWTVEEVINKRKGERSWE